MTSIDRSAYKSGTCFDTMKKRFGTEADAQAAADKMAVKRGHEVNIYACGRHWHLTSQQKRR